MRMTGPQNRAFRSRHYAAGLLLLGILALAGIIRVYNLRDNPAGLFCDEAALGYNAYSILETGRDENGVRFPLYIWSFGGYKNPIYIYTAIIPIALFGLDEFSLRLTSVFFGLLTIWGVYLLLSEILDRKAGLVAALLLAVTHWHIHFSRIAFELVSLPAFFVLGFYFLVRGVKRKKNWCWYVSAVFFGLCFYAYAPSKLQVPLFLLGAAIIYIKEVWRRKIGFLLALAVFALTVAPSLHFSYKNKARAQRYFKSTSIFRNENDTGKLASTFWKNYRAFYDREFLFEDQRDPVIRHSVRNFGVYPRYFLPLSLLGLLFIFVRRDRNMFLVLIWLALYPAAAGLMTEIPSASRSFIGVPVLPIICGYGLYCVFTLVGGIRWRWVAFGIEGAILLAVGYYLIDDLRLYLHEYFVKYPKYSAAGMGGFQHGYRDAIRYMESRRDDYDLLMLTTTSTHQPYIFALFYSGMDPARYLKTRYPGYLILSPKEYRRYSLDKKILYLLREEDLKLFSDLDAKKVTHSPDGRKQFTVAEIRKRKDYITDWMTVGLFDNRGGRGRRDFIDVYNFDLSESYDGRYGGVKWRRMNKQFIEANFNAFYARQPTDGTRGNPENVCAYAVNYFDCPSGREAVIEVAGSPDRYSLWLNRKKVVRNAFIRSEMAVDTYPVELAAGENELLVKTYESVGGWHLLVRIVSPLGEDFDDLSFHHSPRSPHARRPERPKARARSKERIRTKERREKKGEFQIVEGFADVVSYDNTQGEYADGRGGAEGWWEYYRAGGEEVTWETAPCPEKKETVFVFYGQTGEDAGRAQLSCDGKPVLAFDTGFAGDGEWSSGGFRLVKLDMGTVAGHCGLYFLAVPKDTITPGKPLGLTVSHVDGGNVSWFMIKDYKDNVSREHVGETDLPPGIRSSPE